MQKLFKELFILIFCFFLIIGFVEYKLKDKKEPLVQLIENIDTSKKIILIGNSHLQAICGIDDSNFNNITYNLSKPLLLLNDRYRMLEIILKKNNIKKIYFGLDYNQIGEELSNTTYDKQLYQMDGKLYNHTLGNQLFANLKYFSLSISPNQLYTTMFENKPEEKNLNYIPVSNKLKNDDDACQKRAYEHARVGFNKNFEKNCIAQMKNIIDLCKNNDVQIIFINTPKTTCFTNYYLNENMMEAKQKILEICNNEKVIYLDFMNDNRFNDNDFADFDHLNKEGANKLVKLLNIGN